MAERKQSTPASAGPAQPPSAPQPSTAPESGKSTPASGAPSATPPAKESRKWIKKTPVEIVLEQIVKQEERVNGMREELKKEERELQKLQQAKKVLEATE